MSFKQRVPNLLTLARYACVPLLIAVWYALPQIVWLPLALFVGAAATDFLDGYLARAWHATSELGRLLDPNADKLLVACALILLVHDGLASPAAVAIILCRELWVSGLREFMAERHITIHVSKLAKWKTTTQLVACVALLAAHAGMHDVLPVVGSAALWLACVLTLITGWQYTYASLKHLK